MRYIVLAVLLIGVTMLGGCTEGVGARPARANCRRPTGEILLNSLGIMLAIVDPEVIIATLGVAFWFRASNERARYRPNFAYSGRLEVLVWSIPAMTVFLVGGVAWVGAHDLSPRKPIASTVKPLRVQRRLPRLEMAVHLPGRRRCQRQLPGGSRRHTCQYRADLRGRDEQLLRATTRRPDLHHGRNGDPSALYQAGSSGNLPWVVCSIQRRRLFRHAFQRPMPSRTRNSPQWLDVRAQRRRGARRHNLLRGWRSRVRQ